MIFIDSDSEVSHEYCYWLRFLLWLLIMIYYDHDHDSDSDGDYDIL